MPSHVLHDLVAREVRSWYTDWPGRAPGPPGSEPDVGVRAFKTTFGYLRHGPGAAGRRLVLTVDEPDDVSAALTSAREFFGADDFDVWVDDRRRAAVLGSVLTAAGLRPRTDTIVLALVGEMRAVSAPDGLEVLEVTDEEGLRSWARVKIRGFSDGEEEPSLAALDDEMTARRAEWPICRYELATLAGEPAGALAHYTASRDQMVFSLATRVPFRYRGIAESMLRRWAERATGERARSLLINCDERGRPATLYRRMGFVDEVYWHRRYQPATASPA